MCRILDLSLVFCVALGWSLAASPAAADAPLAEKYLLDGKLAEGTKALEGRLKEAPQDDQARFGLGVVQFFQGFEHLGTGLHQFERFPVGQHHLAVEVRPAGNVGRCAGPTGIRLRHSVRPP